MIDQLSPAAGVSESRPSGGILDHFKVPIAEFDHDGRLRYCNQAFRLFYGLPVMATAAGTSLDDLLIAVGEDDVRLLLRRTADRVLNGDLGVELWQCTLGRFHAITPQKLPSGFALLQQPTPTGGEDQGVTGDRDPLTGLLNRAAFDRRLRAAVADSCETFEEAAVLYFDLDRFKPINDTLGHHAGDLILKEVVRRVQAVTRPGDVLARLGGDEFVLLQTDLQQPGGSRSVGNRVIEALRGPFEVEGHTVGIGVSVGVAIAPFDADNPEELLRNADLAMYQAKQDGRNLLRYFEPAMKDRVQARRSLESELRRALRGEQFEVHYQPVKEFGTDRVVAAEALVRWVHPELGRVSPGEFIPLAEETGLVVLLGEWVLRQACRDALNWPDDCRVAVNVSAVQLRNRAFVQTVMDILCETGLPAGRLELEVTETAMLADTELTVAILTELRAAGVKIAMDDFGTGFSSISTLRRFPFDKIKIDRSFVAGARKDSECLALVRMIASLGISLSVATTAEGVETESELEMVRDAGCSQVQGYLLSHPVTADELLRYLSAN